MPDLHSGAWCVTTCMPDRGIGVGMLLPWTAWQGPIKYMILN